MIVKDSAGFSVKSHDGKKHLGGPYPTRAEAEKRLREVEFFKHAPARAVEIARRRK